MNIITPSPVSTISTTQDKINEAIDAASSIRYLIGTMWGAFFVSMFSLRLAPGGVGSIIRIGCFALMVGICMVSIVSLVVWWTRYRGVTTSDIDYQQAKKKWATSLLLCLLMALLLIIPVVLFLSR